ncbi:MAG: nucleotidyltransferase family protein [Candidatus Scalindua rubra]|nr:nucleotidyltransferase family protein [Candidatus Scalindua rubra]TWU33985.1 D-glycero-alpha-D-manno-heptose 1-phosphate guanylyltransferase [Candidatus Brocadiaceae bacterium S225]
MPMQAVILAGGLGTRFRPITLETPKPMIPVMGKPYLEYQLQYLKGFNITDILLCVGYLGEKIQNCFADGRSMGMSITYSFEKSPLGTGGALKNAENYLEDCFYLIYGDSFLPVNYSSLETHFVGVDKTVLMVLYDNSEDTSVPNNVSLDKRGMVTKYEKDTRNSFLKYVDAGVLVLKKEILKLITSEQVVSLEEEFFPDLIERQECAGFVTSERFYDIGTPERLKRFEAYLKKKELSHQDTKTLSKIT